MFTGKYPVALDPKKRLTIPSTWRASGPLTELFIIKASKGCLSAMEKDVLREMGEKIAALTPDFEEQGEFMESFFTGAVACQVDSQGRMVVPDEFCRFAGLEKEIVLTGTNVKFDIWNTAAWEKRQQAKEAAYNINLKRIGL